VTVEGGDEGDGDDDDRQQHADVGREVRQVPLVRQLGPADERRRGEGRGDDAGGGVNWAPQVIEEAADHGLVLAETGKLYDTKKGEALPEGEPLVLKPEGSWFPNAFGEVMARYQIALGEGGEPDATGRDHLAMLEAIEAAYQSMEQGRSIAL